jgi:flagellar protein FliL
MMADSKGAAPPPAKADPAAAKGKDAGAAGKDAPKPAAKKKNPKQIIIIASAVLLLASAAAAGYYFFTRPDDAPPPAADAGKQKGADKGKDKEKDKDKKTEIAKPFFVEFESFTVNLRDPEKFLQIKLTFQVKSVGEAEELKEMMPIVRSAVIPVLSAQDAAELMTAEGKEKLSAAVVDAANKSILGRGMDGAVDAVLITHMIIQ